MLPLSLVAVVASSCRRRKNVAACIGLDISPLALAKARQRFGSDCRYSLAKPISIAARFVPAARMWRIVLKSWNMSGPGSCHSRDDPGAQAGGNIVLQHSQWVFPRFALAEKAVAGLLDHLGAASVWLRSFFRRWIFLEHRTELAVYARVSDCDMISTVFPGAWAHFWRKMAVRLTAWRHSFFQREKAVETSEKQRFQQFELHPFYRHFGDHLLVVAISAANGFAWQR